MKKRLLVTTLIAALTPVLGNGIAWAQRRGGGGRPSEARQAATTVLAVAHERTNSLVVSAPDELMPIIEALIEEIDTMENTSMIRVFALSHADAQEMAKIINDLFKQETQRSSSRQAASSVVAVADERTNSLVVTSPEDVMPRIEELIREIDTMAKDITEVRVFALRYADAEEMAEVIESVFGEDAQTSSRNQASRGFGRGPMSMFFRQSSSPGGQGGGSQSAQKSERKLQETAVVAVADTRTNSVIISASSEMMEQVSQMITEADTNPAKEKRVFVYPLENANVEDVLEILEGMFSQEGARTSRPSSSRSATQQRSTPTSTRRGSGSGSSGGGFGSLQGSGR